MTAPVDFRAAFAQVQRCSLPPYTPTRAEWERDAAGERDDSAETAFESESESRLAALRYEDGLMRERS